MYFFVVSVFCVSWVGSQKSRVKGYKLSVHSRVEGTCTCTCLSACVLVLRSIPSCSSFMLKLKKTRVGIQHCSAEMSLHNFRCVHSATRKDSGAGPRGYSVELPVEGTAQEFSSEKEGDGLCPFSLHQSLRTKFEQNMSVTSLTSHCHLNGLLHFWERGKLAMKRLEAGKPLMMLLIFQQLLRHCPSDRPARSTQRMRALVWGHNNCFGLCFGVQVELWPIA